MKPRVELRLLNCCYTATYTVTGCGTLIRQIPMARCNHAPLPTRHEQSVSFTIVNSNFLEYLRKIEQILRRNMIPRVHCVVVHVKDPDGYDLYGGRPSWLGNPFVIGWHGTREAVIAKFIKLRQNDKSFKERIRKECTGKRIACHCKPFACHLDWVAAVANGEIK